MSKTIVVIYDDIAIARQVVEDLVNADFERNTISLVTNDANNQYSRYLDQTYTPREDAVNGLEGASFGAIVGALTGVLIGIAALTIPGVGLVIVAGPLLAGLTGIVAGAMTGGIVGALVKSGVPEDEAPYYAEGIRRGGTLVSVQTSDTLRAKDIINRHGAVNIHERTNQWRQEGWTGFSDNGDNGQADSTTVKTPDVPIMAVPTPVTPMMPTPVPVTPMMMPNPAPLVAVEPTSYSAMSELAPLLEEAEYPYRAYNDDSFQVVTPHQVIPKNESEIL